MQESISNKHADRILRARSILDWVQARHLVRLGLATGAVLLLILEHAPDHQTTAELLDSVDVSETSARFRMHKKLLPPPSHWFYLGRAVHVAEYVRAHPELSLPRVALQLGYSDHTVLCNMFMRYFGMRAKQVRSAPELETLIEAWWERKAVAA